MSQKQLRKLRELRKAPEDPPENQQVEAVNEDLESSDDQATGAHKGFHALASSSSSSEAGEVPSTETLTRKARRKKRRDTTNDKRPPKMKSSGDDSDDFLAGLEDTAPSNEVESQPNQSTGSPLNPLAMRRQDFSGEAERLRVFGRVGLRDSRRKGPRRARGQGEGKTLHHRRLFLVSLEANEPWPKPDDTSQMVLVLSEDGAVSFDFKESDASTRSLEMLQSVVSQEDPELLQRYLQRSPFSLEGLLVMAEDHRRQGGYDQARELIRRAIYTVECAFAPDFSPFETLDVGSQSSRPRVRLQMPDRSAPSAHSAHSALDWPGWSWLRALWMHMHCLAGQGMHRTSLEVCKLLLAATLPQDPLRALLWLDHLCLRSRQYNTIADLSVSLTRICGLTSQGSEGSEGSEGAEMKETLELAFPNFAYSVGLAGILQQSPDMSLLNHLTLENILDAEGAEDLEGDLLTFARLMRALLYFPGAVRPLLEEAAVQLDSPKGSGSEWISLLTQPPFVDGLTYRHAQHSVAQGRICAAYAKLCGPLWKDEPVKVLHACAVRWVKLHESAIFQKDIVDARLRWANATFAFSETLRDYADALPDDCLANPPVPLLLEHALSARLHPKIEQQMEDFGMFRRIDTVPNMSIYSPPLILFFQSLMPWSVLDHSGVTATPLLWSDIGRGLATALKDTGLFAVEVLLGVSQLLSSAGAMLRQHFRPRRATD